MQSMTESQQYPENIYLINNVEDIVVFLGLNELNSDNGREMCKSLI